MAEYELVFKVLIIGEGNTGKSSLSFRYAEDEFSDRYISTIGVDFCVKTIMHHGKKIKLQIWDTASQMRFRSITYSYYRGAHGVIIVYDITNRSTFENIPDWLNGIENYAPDEVIKVLVGNKSDLLTQRCVTEVEAKSFAERKQMNYIETSAKENTNVDKAFETLIEEMYKVKSIQEQEKETNAPDEDKKLLDGNKSDLRSERCDTEEEAKSVAEMCRDQSNQEQKKENAPVVAHTLTDDANKQKESSGAKQVLDLIKNSRNDEFEEEDVPGWVDELKRHMGKLEKKIEVMSNLNSTVEKLFERAEVIESKVNNLKSRKG